MELTGYELAIIAGGFTIVGAMSGALITYRFAVALAARAETKTAALKLRSAFTSEMAAVRAAHIDTEVLIELSHIIKNSLRGQSAAIEEFRPFVPCCDRRAYQETWKEYYEFASSVYSHDERETLKLANDLLPRVLSFTET